MNSSSLPLPNRADSEVGGHWLLARLGKKILRPGGLELTNALVQAAQVQDKDVVELAPGLGFTAQLLVKNNPRSYTGVDGDAHATATTVAALQELTAGMPQAPTVSVITANAQHTGLPSNSVDVVFAEAMLTMHGDKVKAEIMNEAFRILRPGGRYIIHELSLEPDTLSDAEKLEIRRALAQSIRVNARPLTAAEWDQLGTDANFTIVEHYFADMALLRLKRLLQDEGIVGTLRIGFNALRMPAARRRVLNMRSVFNKYAQNLQAIGIVFEKP